MNEYVAKEIVNEDGVAQWFVLDPRGLKMGSAMSENEAKAKAARMNAEYEREKNKSRSGIER